MASELTPNIGLFKPIPGTAEPFRSENINNNWDILDSSYSTIVELQTELAEEFDTIVADAQEEIDTAVAELEAAVVAASDDILQYLEDGTIISGGTA
jgi:ethanolamine utilization cobalamin adenosyltransferase